MLIKRVVIQGFKTFATKTEFVFDPGITAVVGPNGSGKSNIVDAVRWCLGEQSFSLLRSKKTSDIIFSGSDRKARLGMAQVSITLDNRAGEIPIDFEEVEITRRAYRDGNNEYLINGQRVRLLDVTELLAETGLGKRTYALIGQGLIDKVLSLAPEERRSLFEEAAGITAYQIKRSTTLRRLEATQQNLTRVQDITAELSPRLKYLKRQADRAREREQIANDLRSLLRIWYGYRWHAALAQLEQHHTAEAGLAAGTKQKEEGLARIGREIETLRHRQGALRSQLGERHSAASTLHREAESLSKDLAVVQERLRQTQDRREETQRELAPLRLQQETLEERIAGMAATMTTLETQVQERQTAVNDVQMELAHRQEKRNRLQHEMEDARRHQRDIVQRMADSESRRSQIQERRQVIQAERSALTTSLAQVDADLAKIAEPLQTLDTQLEEVDASRRRHEGELAAVEIALDQSRRDLRDAEGERQQADREQDRLQTRLDLLHRLRNEGAGYASGVRSVLQHAQSGALNGILGTVAALIRTPAELDKAMETALGGALQNVVTTAWDDAQAAIDYLKQSGHGRATFLPLDRLHVRPPIPAPKLEGVLGNAADLVTFDRQVAPAVQQLLGGVWVTTTLAVARRALDQGRGPRPTVVTLEGEIVRPGGAVTGGSDRSRRDESLLARERELRELPDLLTRAQTAQEAAAARCTQLARAVEEAQTQVGIHQEALADLSRHERRLNTEREELRRRLDRVQQSSQYQRRQATDLEDELGRLDEREENLTDLLARLQEEQVAAEAAVTQAEAAMEEAGGGELLTRLADLRAALAEVQGQLRSQQTLHENQQRTLQSISDQIRNKEGRLVQLETEAADLGERVDTLLQREAALGKRLDALQTEIDPAEAQLAQLEKEQAAKEAEERALQQVLRQDETSYNSAQLRRQRTEDLIAQLRHEIEQDLGLVTLEESEEMAYQPPLPLDAFVDQLPVVEEVPDGTEEDVKEMRLRLSRVSNVNPDAPREYEEAAGRHEFLLSQSADLEAAVADLRKVIRELDALMKAALEQTFHAVAKEFEHFFKALFNGGTAKLILTEPDDITNSGIEIIARPPGKRPQSLALLSGGERTLSACALIFAILRVSPTPFCVLDEVDAALDEANVDRFRYTLEELTNGTQFIIVTHNRRTLEGANAIYGVTMGNDGVSRVISLQLDGDRIVHSDGSGGDDQLEQIEEVVQM